MGICCVCLLSFPAIGMGAVEALILLSDDLHSFPAIGMGATGGLDTSL